MREPSPGATSAPGATARGPAAPQIIEATAPDDGATQGSNARPPTPRLARADGDTPLEEQPVSGPAAEPSAQVLRPANDAPRIAPPPPGSIERGTEGQPEIVRHAAAAFKARVTGVVRKNRAP